jgi:glycosyltransferase involved in cell wall biosynthesis
LKISVIIPAYNAAGTIGKTLEACLKLEYPDREIIVVDDGSRDDTPAIVSAFGPSIRLIRQPNGGPASARNAGWRASSGAICFFTDSDCIPEPDALSACARHFADPAVGGVGGTYGIANPEVLLARLIHEEIVYRHSFMTREVDFLGSFNCAYRKSALERAGGFNEEYTTASGEDNDLSYRIRKDGWKLVFDRASVVAHFHETSVRQYLRRQANHGVWRVKLYAKHRDMMKGDKYAGPTDLVQPPLALALAVGLPLLFAPAMRPLYWAALGAYAVLLAVIPVKIAARRKKPEPLLLAPLVFLRGFARAYGLVRGVLKF